MDQPLGIRRIGAILLLFEDEPIELLFHRAPNQIFEHPRTTIDPALIMPIQRGAACRHLRHQFSRSPKVTLGIDFGTTATFRKQAQQCIGLRDIVRVETVSRIRGAFSAGRSSGVIAQPCLN